MVVEYIQVCRFSELETQTALHCCQTWLFGKGSTSPEGLDSERTGNYNMTLQGRKTQNARQLEMEERVC